MTAKNRLSVANIDVYRSNFADYLAKDDFLQEPARRWYADSLIGSEYYYELVGFFGTNADFVQEDLICPRTSRNLPTGLVPGIKSGSEAEDRLTSIGIVDAVKLVEKLFELNLDQQQYTHWFLDTTQAAEECAEKSYKALHDWIDYNMCSKE